MLSYKSKVQHICINYIPRKFYEEILKETLRKDLKYDIQTI